MKTPCKALAAALPTLLLAAAAPAAVRVCWTNAPADPPFAAPPAPRGEELLLEAHLAGREGAPAGDVRMWWQTNGMGAAWWSAPAACSGSVIRASFGPAQDCGAALYRVFLGSPSNAYASAALRLTPSPGWAPNALEPPEDVLDFAALSVANAPWPTFADLASAVAAAEPGDYANVSNRAVSAVQPAALGSALADKQDVSIWRGTTIPIGGSQPLDESIYWYARLGSLPSLKVGNDANNYVDLITKEKLWKTRTNDLAAVSADISSSTNALSSALTAELRSAASAATNHADAALADFAATGTVDYAETAGSTSYASDAGVASLLLDADQENSYTASDFATTQALSSVSASLGQLWSYALGETVWFAVTNYTRGVPGAVPSLQLWEVRDGATNLVYHSSEEITNTVVALWQTLSNSVPSSAWSRYQSNGAENPRPDETTIVTTPEVMLTGGGSWNRHVSTSGNAVWVFQTSGLNTLGASAGGSFLKVIDDDGNTQLEVAKTDSYQVDAVPSGCEFDDLSGDFWIQYAYEGDTPPTLYASTNLTAAGFVAEDANHEIDAYGLSVQWEQGGASWAACVHQDATHPALFVYAKVTQEGRTVVRHAAPAAYDGGILYSNRLFRPVINGSQLIFAEAVE